MFAYLGRAASTFTRRGFAPAYCDATASEERTLEEIEESIKAEEESKDKIKGASLFENLEMSVGVAAGQTFDGFRVIVQKQVNLNTVVSHFYWVGSQQVGQLYQYRLILPFEDKTINVATDMDMNIEGEVSANLTDSVSVSSNFGLGQANKITVNCDMKDSVSATRFAYSAGEGPPAYAMSYVQAMTKNLQLGGKGNYGNGLLKTTFGGMYNAEENVFGAVYNSSVSTRSANHVFCPSDWRKSHNENRIQYLPFV